MSDNSIAKVSFNSSDLNADDFEFLAGTIAGSGQPNGPKVGGAPLTISMDIAGALFDALDHFAGAPFDKLDAIIDAFFDGLALGHAESTLPDADDLAGLAEDLEAQNEKSGTSDIFGLGRKISDGLSDHGELGLFQSEDALDLGRDVAVTDGLPDPLAGADADGGKPSAVGAFTQVRDGLREAVDAAVPARSLTSGADPRTSSDPSAQAPAEPLDAPTASAVVGAVTAIVLGAAAIGVVLSGPIGAGVIGGAAAADGGVALLVSAGTALGFSVGGVLVQSDAFRPAEDGPTPEGGAITLDEFLTTAAEKAAGLILMTGEDPKSARPEDIEAFKLELLDAIWQAVSRPAETDGGVGAGGGGGFDPDDLMHELEPEWDGPSPIPDDINPSEFIDPTGGAGASSGNEGELLA